MKFVHLFGPFGKFYYIKVSRNVIYWGKYSNNGVRWTDDFVSEATYFFKGYNDQIDRKVPKIKPFYVVRIMLIRCPRASWPSIGRKRKKIWFDYDQVLIK